MSEPTALRCVDCGHVHPVNGHLHTAAECRDALRTRLTAAESEVARLTRERDINGQQIDALRGTVDALSGQVGQLTRERDEARSELDEAKRDCLAAVNDAIELRDTAIRERDEARAEVARRTRSDVAYVLGPQAANLLCGSPAAVSPESAKAVRDIETAARDRLAHAAGLREGLREAVGVCEAVMRAKTQQQAPWAHVAAAEIRDAIRALAKGRE